MNGIRKHCLADMPGSVFFCYMIIMDAMERDELLC